MSLSEALDSLEKSVEKRIKDHDELKAMVQILVNSFNKKCPDNIDSLLFDELDRLSRG